ncbi:uncharacterized protein PG986_000706 [Apiospora aurea]|uniref:RNase H type-1 domain-containing protein n=1 Tax=Apiospora aurea TaxID=335848 RepID=A0ABR1QUU8_9PEZI
MGVGKGKATSQSRHSDDIPNEAGSSVAIKTAQDTSEAKPAATSPPRQPSGPSRKEIKKGKKKKKASASHADLVEEDARMKNQPYPRVKVEVDPKESKRFTDWALRCTTGKRMFVFTDGGSCAQASSAAFTYTCLPEGQVPRKKAWYDESYGIVGDIQSREAEMIALIKALEAIVMEAERQALDTENPLRVFVFTDSRDNLHFCQVTLTNGKACSGSRGFARDNVSRALEKMMNQMRSMDSTVKLELHWVKGHSSVHHNKRADSLASTIMDPEHVDFRSKTVAVASPYSPRANEIPEVEPTDVGSVVQIQTPETPEQDAQGMMTERQEFPGGNSPEPMGRRKTEELTGENIAPKRLRRRRQAALVFLKISKPLRSWSR